MNPPPKLLLLIPHLGGGGAEQVIAQLAAGLSAQKYELHLALLTQSELPAKEKPPSWVEVHALGARRVRGGAFSLLRLVRRLKPDLILSGIFHSNFLVLLLRPLFPPGTRILVRQNGTVSSTLELGGLPWYTRLLYRLLYRSADRVICQSPAMARDLAHELRITEDRITVLPNPVDVEGIRSLVAANPPPQTARAAPQLLAIGRLSREKGFDLLLRALALLRAEIPQASLVIAGSGAEEAALKDECRALGLDSVVHFAGYLAHPYTQYPDATLFVLASRHEGLPNALLEAAAAGLPIVATPACTGLVEVLHGQPGVWLASAITAEALAASLITALQSLQPGERFTHPFVEAFRLDRAIPAFEHLIDQTIAAKR
ncbi:MAG TPA: glycosyltransferase [Terracidiphilus sp.]|jgi:glycosyltransferase involved in cell wall biosynthesis